MKLVCAEEGGTTFWFRCYAVGGTTCLFVTSLIGCSTHQPSPSISQTVDHSASGFKPKTPERWTLANGLTVLYLPDSELPIVKVSLYLRGGRLWEKKPGVVEVMGSQIRQGGAGDLSADALDGKLDELSTDISSGYTDEFGSVGFGGQSRDLDTLMHLFSAVVLQPRFEEGRLNLWKSQALDSISRRKDSPDTVASLALRPLVYGPNSVQGRTLIGRDIKAISRSDLIEAYNHFVRPDGAILVITGDLSHDRAKEVVEKYLGGWVKRGTPLGEPGAAGHGAPPGIYFINLPFQQATVYAGQLSVARHTPDEFSIRVFNEVFGGSSFGSLLMHRIRAELGLVYGISGSINSGLTNGENFISFQTKAASTGLALQESVGVLSSLQAQPVAADILTSAKSSLTNSYIFKFATPDGQANRVAALELLGYPATFDQTYLANIAAVTAGQVEEVAQKRWDISQLRVVVVGNDTACQSLVTSLSGKPLDSLPVYRVNFSETIDPRVFVSASSEGDPKAPLPLPTGCK